jgi:hypothetical protein
MAQVLVQGAALECGHGAGITVTATQRKLTVGGTPVLIEDDLRTAVFACSAQTKCAQVIAVQEGLAATLRVGGRAVLLATAKGATNAGTWKATSAGQDTLEAS